jgi:hypothetical protein
VTFLEVLDRRGRLLARHRIDQWPVTVGRAYTSDVIVDDPYVCPAHVRLSRNGDAGLVVEDLGSVNGTRADPGGGRIAHEVVPPDTRLRIGNTMLRVRDAETRVPRAMVHSVAGGGAESLARTPFALAWWLLLVPVLLNATFVQSYQRPEALGVAGTGIFLVLLVAAWAGAWALVTRIVAHEWRFLAHVAVTCMYLAIQLVADFVHGYVALLLGDTWPGMLLGLLCDLLPYVWLFSAHLALVGTANRRRRIAVAAGVALTIVGLGTFMTHWTARQFSSVIRFDGTLEPFPSAWLPGAPIDRLVADIPELEREVRRLAAERPRGSWMSSLDFD